MTNVFIYDIPVFFAGISLLVYFKWKRSARDFQLLSFMVSLFYAQFSLGVSWTLDRVAMLSAGASTIGVRTRTGLHFYIPFVVYGVVASFFLSLSWNIPIGVNYFYGEARLWIQLIQFGLLVLASRALALALCEDGAPRVLWILLRVAGVIHGLASVYQLLAVKIGMPLLGISRFHGLVMDDQLRGDIAAFTSAGGRELLRPGGLAGEPKTVAIIFGIILFGILVTGFRLDRSIWERHLTKVSGSLSALGFLVAMSTSAFGGGLVIALLMLALVPSRLRVGLIAKFVGVCVVALVGWLLLVKGNDLLSILWDRTLGRTAFDLDPPIAAAVEAMSRDFQVLLFGTGLGGSSFLTMAHLGQTFAYSYAPNVGIILIMVELGLVGAALLLLVYSYHIIMAFRVAKKQNSDEKILLATISLASMVLCLTSSGIGIGFPLALGSVASVLRVKHDGTHDVTRGSIT